MWLSMRSDSEVAIWSLVLFRKSLYAHFVSLALLTNGKKKRHHPILFVWEFSNFAGRENVSEFLKMSGNYPLRDSS